MNIEHLATSIAVVHEPVPQSLVGNLTGQSLTTVLKQPLNLGVSVTGELTVVSTRDQMELYLSPNKIDVRDISGEPDQRGEKIAEVAHALLLLLDNPSLQSIGTNFIATVSVPDSAKWLASHLSLSDFENEMEEQLSSNQINLVFQRTADNVVTIQLHSQSDDELYINFNASDQRSDLPSVSELANGVRTQYAFLERVLALLEVRS